MPQDDHLIETRTDGARVFDGALLHINRDTVRLPDGGTATREYVVHPGAVMVIPVLDDGRILMERQFRYPLDRVFLEFPAGKLDPDEAPLACGQRELLEETGHTAREWEYLGVVHPLISYSDEEIHFFLARGLTAGEAQLDEGEFVETLAVPLAELVAGVLDGRITDGKTISGIFWLEKKLGVR
ncbi:NUDIX domain-containing protein [Chitiniphilus eburneus]|uniref:GDP-mannose pyrophosphatase n=1 Tax=Chitiniphilus eburneus TaxID=2571148 RepID=A0A4U0QBE3_9NEIS|nr:NUDIX hydrolase [Chitiniphilus eburneus]TJZ73154.1 NUDIX hydrolase [Chitiniphilus eburneus]